MQTPLPPNLPLKEALTAILDAARGKSLNLRTIFEILSDKGYAILFILFGIPFCLPIPLPGLSTFFGIVLAILGTRMAFSKRIWWPKWILRREVPYSTLEKVVTKTINAMERLKRFLHPRMLYLTKSPLWHRLHGLLVMIMGVLLALPLPIPFTNTMTALPVVCIGIGLLEDDGLLILIAYGISVLTFIFFGALIWLSFAGILHLFHL